MRSAQGQRVAVAPAHRRAGEREPSRRGAASGALYVRFKAKNSEFREQTLRNQAALITDYLKKAPPAPIELPHYVVEEFKANSGRFAVVDRNGALLAASQGVTAPLTAINARQPRDFFVLQPDQEQPYYGLSVRTPLRG